MHLLPLLGMLHEIDPSTLTEELKQTQITFTDHDVTVLDGLFRTSVQEWAKIDDRTEPMLTKDLK